MRTHIYECMQTARSTQVSFAKIKVCSVFSVGPTHKNMCTQTHTHTHVTTPGCVNAKCCCGLKHATCCFCISLSPFLALSISFSLLCTHTLTMSDDMTQSLMKRYVGAPSAERAHLTHTHSCTNEISSYSDREDRITRG